MASVASVLARASTFRRLFFAEHRRPRQTLALLAFFLVPLTLGVWIRISVPNFLAADISFETIILLGLLVGPRWAMLGGVILSAPGDLPRRVSCAPFQCRCRPARRSPGPLRRARRNLVLYAVRRPEPLSLGPPHPAPPAHRPPVPDALPHRCSPKHAATGLPACFPASSSPWSPPSPGYRSWSG